MKELLTTFPTLVRFEVEKKHRINAQASKHFLGAALLQKAEIGWLPVSDASRTMTETKQRYAQIEKEALAVSWACQKFDFFFGRENFPD